MISVWPIDKLLYQIEEHTARRLHVQHNFSRQYFSKRKQSIGTQHRARCTPERDRTLPRWSHRLLHKFRPATVARMLPRLIFRNILAEYVRLLPDTPSRICWNFVNYLLLMHIFISCLVGRRTSSSWERGSQLPTKLCGRGSVEILKVCVQVLINSRCRKRKRCSAIHGLIIIIYLLTPRRCDRNLLIRMELVQHWISLWKALK